MTGPGSGASSSDLVAASRWVRAQVVSTLFASPDAGVDATPLSRSGWIAGPLLALVVVAVVLWGDAGLDWMRARFR
ncbi:hypothetical protein [Nocardioides yefusunii]|uniref:Uncharacterized protein n=1 Tax=Nocardioides yefusunii TaxID=2500546 RepID=A0ABW1QZQ2_9ACTN|nr:hypothetical protein [Nocardioides yefusunii]